MSYDLERKVFEEAFKDEMPEGAAIQFGNTPYQPPVGGFTRISVMSGGSSMMSVGTPSQRRYSGIIDVAIFVPVDEGTVGLRAIAEQIEAALAHRSFTRDGMRIVTFGSDLTIVGKQGDWFQGNVSVGFERDGEFIVTSLRTFGGRRMHTMGGNRLNRFTDLASTRVGTFGGDNLTTFGGNPITLISNP